MKKKILIVSFGSASWRIEKEIISKISYGLSRTFNIKVKNFGQMPIPWTAKRDNQLKASDFLAAEKEILENKPAEAILGICKKDLYLANLSFVFGLASPKDQVAIISLARLSDDNKKLFFARLGKEAIHEIGHLFGLDHCEDKLCAMSFSNSIGDVDIKKSELCPNCQKLAGKNVKKIS